jgi:hypothetical protein
MRAYNHVHRLLVAADQARQLQRVGGAVTGRKATGCALGSALRGGARGGSSSRWSGAFGCRSGGGFGDRSGGGFGGRLRGGWMRRKYGVADPAIGIL